MSESTKSNSKNRLYRQILMSYILIAVITVIICATVLSVSFQRILIDKIYSAQEDNLHSATYSMDDAYQAVKSLMLQLYFDEDISMLRHMERPDDADIITSMKRLGLYSAILPNVKSLYIYSDVSKTFYDIIPYGPRTVYSYNDFYDTYAKSMVASMQDFSSIYPINRVFPVIDGTGAISQTQGYTYIFMNKRMNNETGEGAIIINVSQTWIQDIIGKYNSPFASSTYIIDKTGQIIYDNGGIGNSEKVLDAKEILSKLAGNTESGYYLTQNGSEQSIVIYSKYKPLSWILVRIIPLNDITNEESKVRIEALLIGVIVLLLGGIVAFLLSRRIYKPIDRLIHQLKDLESENNNTLSIKKREFLKKLVLGVSQSGSNGAANLKVLECPLDPNGIFVLLHLTIDRYIDFYNNYSAVERERVKSAIINISSKICAKYFTNEGLDMDESHALLLINIPRESSANYIETVSKIVMDIQSTATEAAGLSISVALSPLTEAMDSISTAYNDVKKLSMEKFFTGPGSFLRPETVQKIDFSNYKHPSDSERKLTEYLLSGEIEKAKQTLDEILNGLSQYTFYTLRLELLRLTADCFTALNLVEKNKGISLPYSFERFVSDIESIESLIDVKDYFYRFFQSVIHDLDENRLNRQNDLVKRVYDIILKGYRDTNLSLFSIADEIGMSPAYLGRAYKKLTSMSVLDCINGMRIDKAQNLLVTTDKPIKDICSETGYTNSQHFYRVFKKSTGVTPVEYRNEHKKPGSSK